MKTVAEIRAYARTYFDLSSADLPDMILDGFMRAGYLRICNSRFEHVWLQASESKVYAAGQVSQSTALRRVVGVRAGSRPMPLRYIDHQEIQVRPEASSVASTPLWWSWWGGQVFIYPTPSAAITVRLDGFAAPSHSWVGQPSQSPPLLPDDYEPALLSWVLCETAKWQQDAQSANNFAQDFSIELEETNARFTSIQGVPVVMNGGHSYRGGSTNNPGVVAPW